MRLTEPENPDIVAIGQLFIKRNEKMGRLFTLVLLLAVVFTCLCSAKPLDPTIVDSDAGWLFHADYDQFNKSKTGNLIKQQMSLLGLDSHLTDFSDKFAFNPLEDVNGVSIYGQGEDRSKAVAIVYANFEKQVLLDLLEKDSTHEVIEYENQKIHKFRNKKRANDEGEIVFVLLNTGNIILSTGLDAVKTAADNQNAGQNNISNTALISLVEKNSSAIIQLAGINIAENMSPKNDSIVLKQTDTLSITIGERQGIFYIDSNLSAYDLQPAIDIENMMRGFISLGYLANEKHPEWTKIAQATQVIRKDKAINVYFEAEPEFILSMMNEAWKKKIEKKCMGFNP